MRLPSRLTLTLAVGMLATGGVAVWSCGTGAVGVQACQTIEYERCMLAPVCTPGFDVSACERFYRDECLVGLQATSDTNDNELNSNAEQCSATLSQVAACVSGTAEAGTCETVLGDAGWCLEVDASTTFCNVLLDCPEVLPSCAFVGQFLTDGGSDADSGDTDLDAGDAASE